MIDNEMQFNSFVYDKNTSNIGTSISDNESYPAICDKASIDDTTFDNFKTYPKYKDILEHVSVGDGQLYYNILENTEIINSFDKFKINDTLGNPLTYDYGLGDISPTTLRYMKVLNDLMGNWDLSGKDIIEIGCGYGGQCTVLKQLINVKSYSVVDLPEVIKLAERYLSTLKLNSNMEFMDGTSSDTEYGNYDLIISNYAISECTERVQKEYLEKIISKCGHGYITYNDIHQHFNLGVTYMLGDFINDLKVFHPNVKIIDETPLTSSNNKVLIW